MCVHAPFRSIFHTVVLRAVVLLLWQVLRDALAKAGLGMVPVVNRALNGGTARNIRYAWLRTFGGGGMEGKSIYNAEGFMP